MQYSFYSGYYKMKTDLLQTLRSAFGRVGDIQKRTTDAPPPPPRVERHEPNDEDALRVFDRIEYLMKAQESGKMKRLINAHKDISNHLGLDHFFVMSIVREVCNPNSYRAAPKRFDRETREE
jgi:hypothetical protein